MFMKILLISFALLFPHINQAQTKPSSRIKKPIIKSTNSIALKHDKPIEKLMIGDTCYVTTANLPLRGRPTAATPGVIQLRHNTKVTVQEIVNNQWILIDYYNQDVGVQGYVSRQCVSRKKAD